MNKIKLLILSLLLHSTLLASTPNVPLPIGNNNIKLFNFLPQHDEKFVYLVDFIDNFSITRTAPALQKVLKAKLTTNSLYKYIQQNITRIYFFPENNIPAFNLTTSIASMRKQMEKERVNPYHIDHLIASVYKYHTGLNLTASEIQEMPRGSIALGKLTMDEEPLLILATVIHEGRHTDGKIFDHVRCIHKDILASNGKKPIACDRFLNGPFGVQAAFLLSIGKYCTNCTEYQKKLARYMGKRYLKHINPLWKKNLSPDIRKSLFKLFE